MNAALEICMKSVATGAVAVLLSLPVTSAKAQYLIGSGQRPGEVNCGALNANAVVAAVRSANGGQLDSRTEQEVRRIYQSIRTDLAQHIVNERGIVKGTGRSLIDLPGGRQVLIRCTPTSYVP